MWLLRRTRYLGGEQKLGGKVSYSSGRNAADKFQHVFLERILCVRFLRHVVLDIVIARIGYINAHAGAVLIIGRGCCALFFTPRVHVRRSA